MKITFILKASLLLILLTGCQHKNEDNPDTTTPVSSGLTVDDVAMSSYFPDSLLDRFQEEIAAFRRADSLHPTEPGAALFVGSSSIRMWDNLQADMAPVPVINRGFGGSTLPEVLYYFDQLVTPHQPKVILLYSGENDLAMEEAGITPEQVKETFEIFVNTVNAKLPETEKIYFISIKPSVARWDLWPSMQEANRLIRNYANSQEKVYFIDVAEKMMGENKVRKDIFMQDSLHMNRKGYALWIEAMKPELLKDFKAD